MPNFCSSTSRPDLRRTAPVQDTTSPATLVVQAGMAPRAAELLTMPSASDEVPQPGEPRFMLLRLRRGLVRETWRVTHVVLLEDDKIELPDVVQACCGMIFNRLDADQIPPNVTSQPCFGCLLVAPFSLMKVDPQ